LVPQIARGPIVAHFSLCIEVVGTRPAPLIRAQVLVCRRK
jgi:hypothetical protein